MNVASVPAPVFSSSEDRCTTCGKNPVYIGTMCRECYEKKAWPGRGNPPVPGKEKNENCISPSAKADLSVLRL